MSIESLMPGDILIDNCHCGIYIGYTEQDPKHCIAHSLIEGFYGGNLRNTSMDTFLDACLDPPKIFRCKNDELAGKAAFYARGFSKNKDIPFDMDRLSLARIFHDEISHINSYKYVKEQVHEIYFQTLKS